MIVNRSLFKNLFKECMRTGEKVQRANITNRDLIGNRDWVAFGKNGTASYADDVQYPFPAVRFKPNTNELLALREKEKGDWRKLTIEEKKILYRASFRQTFQEVNAPTGEWKSILGWVLVCVSAGLWIFYGCKFFVLAPLPETFSEKHRMWTLRKRLDLKMGYATGISSQWDYENDTWKK